MSARRRCAAALLGGLLLGLPLAAAVGPAIGPILVPPARAQGWVPARTAKLQALDKVTARVTLLDAPLDQPVRFGSLTITVRACHARPADEVPDAAAFLEIADGLAAAGAPPVFRGWLLANAPAVHMLEHPVYDVRILECR